MYIHTDAAVTKRMMEANLMVIAVNLTSWSVGGLAFFAWGRLRFIAATFSFIAYLSTLTSAIVGAGIGRQVGPPRSRRRLSAVRGGGEAAEMLTQLLPIGWRASPFHLMYIHIDTTVTYRMMRVTLMVITPMSPFSPFPWHSRLSRWSSGLLIA